MDPQPMSVGAGRLTTQKMPADLDLSPDKGGRGGQNHHNNKRVICASCKNCGSVVTRAFALIFQAFTGALNVAI